MTYTEPTSVSIKVFFFDTQTQIEKKIAPEK